MCGIAGARDPSHSQGTRWVETLNAAQAHRGPDHAVAAQFGDFVLGNTRLAIQDPTPDGNQPYVSPDGRWVAVLNGELYNYRELISRFSLSVTSRCDGAVITPLWERFGDAALDLLRGMFALAVLDTVEQRLVLARDPFGIKPLFWRKMPHGAMAFASEPRHLANLGAPAAVRPETVAEFLHLGAPSRESGLFHGITAVPANGTVAFIAGNQPVESVRPRGVTSQAGNPDRSTDQPLLADAFVESLKLHLRSDVPVALLLSAGVDSSVIAAGAARLGNHLTCLTVDGPGTAGEGGIANATAAHYGHDHRTIPVALEPSDLETFFAAMQRPTIDGLNTFLVCKAVNDQRIRVAISGLGGDEALGGYSTARLLPILPALRAADRRAAGQRLLRVAAPTAVRALRRPKLARVIETGGPRDARALVLVQRELFPQEIVTRLCGVTPSDTAEPGPTTETTNSPRRLLARAEIETYLTRMLLPDADAFSMCWSVELRVPFVDPIFFAHAITTTAPAWAPKRALVDGFEDPYLRRLTRRRKTGFGLPMTRLMANGPLAPLCDRMLATDAQVWSIIDRHVADKVFCSGTPTRWSERWAFVALNEWLLQVGHSA